MFFRLLLGTGVAALLRACQLTRKMRDHKFSDPQNIWCWFSR